ncbi:TetR family transcriptional regulator [Streptomyces sp. NPDC005492]|uniref:TetR/AcrR family transcriptional regulator n=1 Tax=Streptomyces sp. NPDC005492 TaxID=3156883 RepID=UPI0033B753F2
MAHTPVAERRPQLVQAAIKLMAREGISAGSTRAVAAELGVAQATVHYTFGTKQELYRAVLEELTRSQVAQVEQVVPAELGFEETLGTWIDVLWQSVRAQRDRYLLLTELTAFALRDPYLHEATIEHTRNVTAIVTRLVGEAASGSGLEPAVEPEVVARFFLAGFDGLILYYLTEGEDEPANLQLSHLRAATIALATGRLSATS